MYPFWRSIIRPTLTAASARSIVEVGCEHGKNSSCWRPPPPEDRASSRSRSCTTLAGHTGGATSTTRLRRFRPSTARLRQMAEIRTLRERLAATERQGGSHARA